MHTEVTLNITPEQAKRLSKGLGIRITRHHMGKSTVLSVTSTQAAKLAKVADGTQGYMLLRLSAPALKRTTLMHGGSFGSFFSSIGDAIKDTFTKPSGILGALSMLPTPLSTPLKAASVITKLTGNGAFTKRRSPLFNHEQFNHSETPLFNTDYHKAIEEALRSMEFKPHHIEHMKGAGIFSTIWSGVRKIGSILKPYAKKEGMRLLKEYGPDAAKFVVGKLLGRGPGIKSHHYYVKFTAPQQQYIRTHMDGDGIFSDLKGRIEKFVRSTQPKPPMRLLGLSQMLNKKGGNLMTLGSVH